MANNRIFIKCNVCGAVLSIAKSFGAGFSPNVEVHDTLYDFMKEHTFCSQKGIEGDFDLVYEFAPDGEEAREID